jgi:hypothetical protein
MVIGMTMYNFTLKLGFSSSVLMSVISLQFIGVLVVAFLIDWFVVGRIVKSIVKRFLPENAALVKKVLTISILMVLLMCTAMSTLATLVQYGADHFLADFTHVFSANLIFALPLNLLIVGPLARAVFLLIFKPSANPAAASGAV